LTPIGQIDFLKKYGKIRDVKAAYDNIDIVQLIIRESIKTSEDIARSEKLNLIMGETPSIVLAKLKATLAEKQETLKAFKLT